jgi:hypothetical protein
MITSFENLRAWFMANVREGETSPHWSLFGTNYGVKDDRISFNTRLDDMDASFDFLASTIRMLNNPDGKVFRVQQYPKGKANNVTGQVSVQIFEGKSNSAAPVAGIGSLPDMSAYIGRNEVAALIAEHQEKWEMKQRIRELEDQLESPAGDWTDKLMQGLERIGATPFGAVIAARLMNLPPGALPPMMSAPMNGTPTPDHAHAPDADADDFDDNIDAAAEALGITPEAMAAKLRTLVTANPEMARTFLL